MIRRCRWRSSWPASSTRGSRRYSMTVSRAAMAAPDLPRGQGERREAAKRRKRMMVFAAIFAIGLASGMFVGFQEADALFHGGDGAWSPAFALGMIGLFVGALAGGTFVMHNAMDELDRERT